LNWKHCDAKNPNIDIPSFSEKSFVLTIIQILLILSEKTTFAMVLIPVGRAGNIAAPGLKSTKSDKFTAPQQA